MSERSIPGMAAGEIIDCRGRPAAQAAVLLDGDPKCYRGLGVL